MKRSYYYVSCCLLALLLNTIANAAPITSEKVTLYSIRGSTATELRAQMRKLGPLESNHPYDAYTRYYVKWRFQFDGSRGVCKIGSARVTVDIHYTYPDWKNYDDASPVLQRNWNDYMFKLKNHEHGHAEHGLQAGSEIDDMLMNLPAMTNCEVLEQTANAKAYSILGKYQQADVDYDRETNHGIAQGVVLQDE